MISKYIFDLGIIKKLTGELLCHLNTLERQNKYQVNSILSVSLNTVL